MRLLPVGLFIITVCSVFITGCQWSGTGISKNVTGRPGEIVVVANEDFWEGNPGTILRQSLAQHHVALPQDEPVFDLIQIPIEAFTHVFKSTRNILQLRISPNLDSYGVGFQEDLWASPQAVATIHARSEEDFADIFRENEHKIISYFLKAERDRLNNNYARYYERYIYNVLSDNFGVTMNVAPGFQIALQEDNFIWLRYETPEISQGIILYTYPYSSESVFLKDYQVAVRDSLLKTYIPGPTEGSYMATELRIDQIHNVTTHNGNYTTEMRGLWRLMNDYMGGPYISLAELDIENQRVISAFGYVYAPSKNKRNFLRQMEAMLYSMRLNNQENNDILNRQLSLGE